MSFTIKETRKERNVVGIVLDTEVCGDLIWKSFSTLQIYSVPEKSFYARPKGNNMFTKEELEDTFERGA